MQALEARFCGEVGGGGGGGDEHGAMGFMPFVDMTEDQDKTRLRIVGIVKAWLEGHFYDFLGDYELLDVFLAFVDKIGEVLGGSGGAVKEGESFFFFFFFFFLKSCFCHK